MTEWRDLNRCQGCGLALNPVARAQQRDASDPGAQVWVRAAAGTGKTHVLTNRVLRLLLRGHALDGLLCLTFTKAAAAEMIARVTRELSVWATCCEACLPERLRRLSGAAPDQALQRRARALFARALDLPAGLPIMTLHSFAERLLGRFPVEAGVSPYFQLLEGADEAALIEALHRRFAGTPQGAALLERLASWLGEVQIDSLRAQMRHDVALRAHWHRTPSDLAERLRAAFGLEHDATTARVCLNFAIDAEARREDLLQAAGALERGTTTDQKNAAKLRAWLARPLEERAGLISCSYAPIFLNSDNTIPKRPATKGALQAWPGIVPLIAAEQEHLMVCLGQLEALDLLQRSEVYWQLGHEFHRTFAATKRRRGEMTFDDLIEGAALLLDQPGNVSWVNFKLDQAIDHLLIDEAQDTAPAQWRIVKALYREFFAGHGRPTEHERTVFVVGDDKQSIYSFQGADMHSFTAERGALRDEVAASARSLAEIGLNRSFRTTTPVLNLVDAVFAEEMMRAGVVMEGETLQHETERVGEAGQVEVWPLLSAGGKIERPDDWHAGQTPLDEGERDPERDLADTIARQIKRWLDTGERLASQNRPIRPGDVMILLPRRGKLQGYLVRVLKSWDVPVAGADRLRLSDQLAVQDLLAVGRALLLPDDDLTLATALRTPIFGLSTTPEEEDLFALCAGRGRHERVYQRLRHLAQEGHWPAITTAYDLFERLRAKVDFMPPFEFFCDLLGPLGGRKRLLERLGPDAAEPIEAFLGRCLHYEHSAPPSLQGVVHWLERLDDEIKRDPEQPRDEVRILTCHSAKGLEAPIVFLAETTYSGQDRDMLLSAGPDDLPCAKPSAKDHSLTLRRPALRAALDTAERARQEESRRLLYVALTRARDRLYICGRTPRRGNVDATWYGAIARAMRALAEQDGWQELHFPNCAPHLEHLHGTGWRLRCAQSKPVAAAAPRETITLPDIPDWAWTDAQAEPIPSSPLAPSRLVEEETLDGPTLSPLSAPQRFARGRLTHRLLQLLPDQPVDERPRQAAAYLAHAALEMAEAERQALAQEVLTLLARPDLAPLFGANSRAEVPLTGRLGPHVISGRADRLAVLADRIMVVDYKSNREPPNDPAQVSAAYWAQMAAYRALLQPLYPGRAVQAFLLWTATGAVMPLDDALLDSHAKLLTLSGPGPDAVSGLDER